MPSARKVLAFSLPLSLAALAFVFDGGELAVHAAGSELIESPAQLRLSALDSLMKGDKHAALDSYEGAIKVATSEFGADSTFLGDLYYEAGEIYLELDQFNQAEDCLRQAVKINPKNASARLALARLLDLREKVQESIGQIREALLINPSSPVARHKFVQTLAKYGQSPSDKAIATQESVTLAMMQKTAREQLQKALTGGGDHNSGNAAKSANKPGGADKKAPLTVPVLPKNLVPLKEEQGKSSSKENGPATEKIGENAKKESAAASKAAGASKNSLATEHKVEIKETSSETKASEKESAKNSATAASESKPAEIKPSTGKGPSLFPLKDMSERKLQEELNRRIEERARKRMEDAIKKGAGGDVVDKLKEQAHQHEKDKAEERAQRERADRAQREKAEKEKSEKGHKEKAKASKAPAKTESKPAVKEEAPVKGQPQVQQPAPQAFYPPPVYQMPVFTAPKPKAGKGFVPPPPPSIPMMPGMMPPPVMPQVIPAPQTKPAAVKKVEKPKAAPKEESKPAEDKPPPMTTTENSDPDFLLDWGELPKNKAKKKAK